MIPFWKKTDKGGKKTPPKPAIPHTAQQSIPMQRMFEDGTCRVRANYYTRTIAYQDINYQLAQQEDKNAIFEEWCSFLNFFDSSIKFELSFVNMATDSSEFEKSIRIPYSFAQLSLSGSKASGRPPHPTYCESISCSSAVAPRCSCSNWNRVRMAAIFRAYFCFAPPSPK